MLPIMVASPSEESNTRATLSHKLSLIHSQDSRNFTNGCSSNRLLWYRKAFVKEQNR